MKDSIYHNSQALSAIQYSPVAFYHINSFPWWVLYIRYRLNWHLSQVLILRGNCSLPIQASDVTFNQRTNPDINLNPACCFFFRYVWTFIKNLTIHCYDIPSTHCSRIFFKHYCQWEPKSDRYVISPYHWIIHRDHENQGNDRGLKSSWLISKLSLSVT